VTTREKPWPFFQAAFGAQVIAVNQIGLDRIIRIGLKKDNERFVIIDEILGPNGNFWLLDADNKIFATLRNKKYDPESTYAPPGPPPMINPFRIDTVQLAGIFDKSETVLDYTLKKNIYGLDITLAREIIIRAGLKPEQRPDEINEAETEQLIISVKNLIDLFGQYAPGYVSDNGLVAPFKLKSIETEWEKYETLSLAVYDTIKSGKITRAENSEKQKFLDAVGRYIRKVRRKVTAIEKDIESAGKHEQHRVYAELLKANLTRLKKGMTEIELENLYNENNETVTIKLDPALTPNENAENYFKKYRKGKESLALLKRRLEIAGKELSAAETMQNELHHDFDTAAEKYKAEIVQILPGEISRRAEAPRLPYRPFTLASGVTIFVGKDGTDNDATTFHHARPYELWFHTSQCPGSHVVLKFPDKNFKPSKNEIAETAAAAAFYSKAKKSKTVPVIYTERKYVRKPRGAKPGLVTVEREKMVMVEPKKPE